MTVLIAWLVVAAIAFLGLFVTARLLNLIFRRNKKSRSSIEQTPTPESDQLGDAAEDIAKASRVAAGLATAGAYVAAPKGLAALGAAIGLVSAPFVVKLAPLLVTVAFGATAISAAIHLYLKYRHKKSRRPTY